MTMAASGNPGTLKWLRKEFLLETMDWINVMTYDYTGDWTNYAGHHSPLFASSKQPGGSPLHGIDHEVPARRAGVCPRTGWRWGFRFTAAGSAVARAVCVDEKARRGRAGSGGQLQQPASSSRREGLDRKWDDETKNPWLHRRTATMVIGYDDAESVALKTEWAMKQGFRGVFFWQVAGDLMPDNSNPVQEAARAKLAVP